MPSVPDPYRALNLPHDATAAQIKRSYRELARKYHPDRCCIPGGGEGKQRESDDDDGEEAMARRRSEATAKFAAISAAYAVLSDPQRKAQYDHVYKYGGYDEEEDEGKVIHEKGNSNGRTGSRTGHAAEAGGSSRRHDGTPGPGGSSAAAAATRKRKSTGIGYACVDPLAFLWTHGRVQAKMAVAGIQIPSRLHHPGGGGFGGGGGAAGAAHGDGLGGGGGGGGFRFAFSSAHLATSPNGSTKVWQSKTTSYCRGQKFTRVETTTIHPDGRTETVVDHNPVYGDDYGQYGRDGIRPSFFSFGGGGAAGNGSNNNDDGGDNKSSNDHRSAATTTAPWYAHAWSGIKDKLMMCYSPCTVTAVQ